MYDWRIFCNHRAREYADAQSLVIADNDLGHLEHFHYGGERVCEDLIRNLQLNVSDHILDAGCGIGGSSRTLSRHELNTVGVDANAEFIEYAESISEDHLRFRESRLEDLEGLRYDAWFALLVFVHVADRKALFRKLENDCATRDRFFIETIISDSKRSFFETPLWNEKVVRDLMPEAKMQSKTMLWKSWTEARVERFLQRRSFFEDLYGRAIVEQRMAHYENIAEGFQSGALEGRRIIGSYNGSASIVGPKKSEMETDLKKTCIIEFDQILDIT